MKANLHAYMADMLTNFYKRSKSLVNIQFSKFVNILIFY